MKKNILFILFTLLLLSSCFSSEDKEKDLVEVTIDKQENIEEESKKDVSDEKKIIPKQWNEMMKKDNKTEDDAVEEFEKDVEEILKLLEDNG